MSSQRERLAEPRWATAEDDAALRRLARRVPMVGPLSYCLEREPDFFALTRLQGEGGRVAVVDGEAGELAAMAMVAPDQLRLFQLPQRILYGGDMKVDPSLRSHGLAGKMMRFVAREMIAAGFDLIYGLVLAGNPNMEPIIAARGAPVRFYKLATLANYTVFFGPKRRPPKGISVRRATDGDLGAMVALWNRVQAARELTPIWDEEGLRRRLQTTPGLSLADYLVAERDGRLVGLLAAWDSSVIKQLRLLRLSTGLAWVRRLYNPLAALLGRPRVPADGQHLPFFYIAQPCAETADDLRALLVEIHNQRRDGGHVYFDVALDDRDPLLPALDGFWKTRIRFDVHLMDLAGRFEKPPVLDERPTYFDISLV
jgi:hypothetical protein